jgi:16S rRNA (cytosine967-C5)-methyltransferase
MAWLGRAAYVRAEDLPLGVRADLPDWVVERLRPFMSDEAILGLGLSLQQPAPLDVRVNTLLSTREEALKMLRADGFEAAPTPYSPVGLRFRNKVVLTRHPLFLEGQIEVQDEGSQILAYLVDPRPGEMVVDFCAGAGGKTLALGALMRSRGTLYALDVARKRLENLTPRLRRSRLSNVHPRAIADENDVYVKRLAGKIDRVLVDAPCSGLGTARRNPDLKWRQTPETVRELSEKQARILRGAARLVKPGGRLVYATCSILHEENEEIVEQFLRERPEFALKPCRDALAQAGLGLDTGPYLNLTPATHGTDGFFAAALERGG